MVNVLQTKHFMPFPPYSNCGSRTYNLLININDKPVQCNELNAETVHLLGKGKCALTLLKTYYRFSIEQLNELSDREQRFITRN